LDDLIQAGMEGLLRAATLYRPAAHANTPFEAFARPRIKGEILNSVRRRKFVDATHEPLDAAAGMATDPNAIDIELDRKKLREKVARIPLTQEQRGVIDAYYSPEMPTLLEVAETLEMKPYRAFQTHVQALETIREEIDEIKVA
jgi:RNA polymerase sigma factor (sigma-70 family)